MHTDYIRALLVLQRMAGREIDRAQLSEAPQEEFLHAVEAALTARRRVLHPVPR